MDLLPESGIFSMLMQATLMVKLVLLFLVSMSIWCWSIIIFKILLINKAKRQVVDGYEAFLQAEDLSAGLHAVNRDPQSPLAIIGSMAVREFRKLETAEIDRERKRFLVKDTLRRILRQAVSAEMKRLSSSISILATSASSAPFIGLFGTVWGIMHSFHSIGQAQSAALATVAPGISEALIATAIGLGVAIPASIAYNFFLGMLAVVETEMVNFAGAFLNRVEREVSWVSARGQRRDND
ncbi:MotA/TolQ/ExbB proton channel family protein [Desulfovibrio sp.]